MVVDVSQLLKFRMIDDVTDDFQKFFTVFSFIYIPNVLHLTFFVILLTLSE